MAKPARVRTASGTWVDLASSVTDLSNYSTTSQMNTAIDNAIGLKQISKYTLSGASSAIFTNLSAGSRYRVSYNLYASTNGAYVYFKFREGSTDKSSSYYGAGGYSQYNGNSGNLFAANGASQITLSRLTSTATTQASLAFDLFIDPSKVQGVINGQSYNYYDSFSLHFGFHNDAMTSCDGINIYPSTGTFSGSMTLWKYKD